MAVPIRPILILGLGNILMRDEGVGVCIVEAMRGMDWPADAEMMEGGTAGFGLLDAICGRQRVIVLDAVECEGAPGTVVQFRVDPAQVGAAPCCPVSLHEVGLVEVLRAARLLNAAPREVIVLGVKPAAIESGLDLTSEVASAIPKVIAVVKALVVAGKADRPEVEADCSAAMDASANWQPHRIAGKRPVAFTGQGRTGSKVGATEEPLI